MAGWVQTITKKKTNSQNQPLNRTSFTNLFNNAGVQGQPGATATAPTEGNPAASLSDEGTAKESVSYNSSGAGLIPGTQAYADWQKQQASNSDTIKNPAAGSGQTDPPESAPGSKTYSFSNGVRTFTANEADINNVISGMSPELQSAVMGALNSGTPMKQLGRLYSLGLTMPQMQQLQAAFGFARGKGDRVMPSRSSGLNYGNYQPAWMQKRIDRNMAAQYEPEPAAPYVPNMPGYIREDQLPPGYTPINGTYDPQSGQPMISQAVGPDGSVWGVGADGMPVQLGGPQQAPPQNNYPGVNYPNYNTGTNQLPPEMMDLLMSQLPYFNMYMQGATPY